MTRSRREIEALTDILLGEVSAATNLPESVADRVVLLAEAHLPVRGVLWRLAAANLVAGDTPATLLELDDGQIHVTELGGATGGEAFNTLEHVIARPAAGHTWLVAASGPSPWAGECGFVDEVVLLTGADQAAVVGAYRAAKQIVAEVGKPELKLGIVIAGSPQSIAEDVWARLSETIEMHLGLQPFYAGALPQLDVAASHARATVPLQGARLGVLIDSIRVRATAGQQESTPRGVDEPVRTVSQASITQPPTRVENPKPRISPAPPPEVKVPTLDVSVDHPGLPSSQPQVMAESAQSRLLPLPSGLSVLELETPLPSGVRLARDAEGGLHVLASESDTASLESGRLWATAHIGLLAAAMPLIDASRPVVCDVLVENIHRAASLAGGVWNVHLIQGDSCVPVPDPPS